MNGRALFRPIVFALPALMLAVPAWAGAPITIPTTPVAASGESVTLGEVTRLHNEILVLKQQLEIAKLRAEIKRTSHPGLRGAPSGGASVVGSGYVGMPSIRSIFGAGRALEASLATSNGSVVTVRAGDHVSGMRVTRISRQEVLVDRDGRIDSLSWSAGENETGSALNGLMNGLPGMGGSPSQPPPTMANPIMAPPVGTPGVMPVSPQMGIR